MTRFDQDVPQFTTAKKTTPTVNGWVAVLVPAGFGLSIGLAALLLSGLVCWAFQLSVRFALAAAGSIGLMVMLGAYLNGDKLLYSTEEITNRDWNHDGMIGRPEPQYTAYELRRADGTLLMGDVPVAPELLIEWCEAAAAGRSLAYSAWEPRFALPDGTRGRENYTAFRDFLVRRGFAQEVGGNVGLRVAWRNPDAVAFVRGFAEIEPCAGTPLLEGGRGET